MLQISHCHRGFAALVYVVTKRLGGAAIEGFGEIGGGAAMELDVVCDVVR
jgi:hypothetical protein